MQKKSQTFLDQTNVELKNDEAEDEEFLPDWASPPGDTLSEVMKRKGVTPTYLSAKTGIPEREITAILNGKLEISVVHAHGFSQVLGVSSNFWLTRERHYRQDLKRIKGGACG